METLPPPIDTKSDRIKLPFTFDVEKMKQEIQNMGLNDFNYYDVKPLRSPAHLVDPSLPIPPPADDYADGTWTDWLNTPELEKSPYLKSIVEFFQAYTFVALVRVLRLEKGQVVTEHTDPTLGLQIEKSLIRLTIPVMVEEGVDFFLNQKPVPMKPGECWYLRLTDPHSITNHSIAERVNVSIDMIPNQWVQDQILKHDDAA